MPSGYGSQQPFATRLDHSAARIDGANEFRIFGQMAIPMSLAPALLTILPVLTAYSFTQKTFVRGAQTSGLKGQRSRHELADTRVRWPRNPSVGMGLMTDSPVGLAAWFIEKFRAWSDCDGHFESFFPRTS